jgi:hypothetical protein
MAADLTIGALIAPSIGLESIELGTAPKESSDFGRIFG